MTDAIDASFQQAKGRKQQKKGKDAPVMPELPTPPKNPEELLAQQNAMQFGMEGSEYRRVYEQEGNETLRKKMEKETRRTLGDNKPTKKNTKDPVDRKRFNFLGDRIERALKKWPDLLKKDVSRPSPSDTLEKREEMYSRIRESRNVVPAGEWFGSAMKWGVRVFCKSIFPHVRDKIPQMPFVLTEEELKHVESFPEYFEENMEMIQDIIDEVEILYLSDMYMPLPMRVIQRLGYMMKQNSLKKIIQERKTHLNENMAERKPLRRAPVIQNV